MRDARFIRRRLVPTLPTRSGSIGWLLVLLCLMMATSSSLFAANGTAEYFDVNSTTAGFGTPSGSYNINGNFWSTDSTGVTAPGAMPNDMQWTFGSIGSDFAGTTFTISANASVPILGLLINSTSANITLSGSQNNYLNGTQTWTVAAGSTLTEAITFNGIGMNCNSSALTLAGGGTINFTTPMGYNSGSGGGGMITQNGSGLVVNLSAAAPTSSPYGAGYTLTAGTLNFATAASVDAFKDFTLSAKPFAINGGTVNNTSGGSSTLSVGAGGYSVGGDFTFTGSSNLNFGTAPVVLTGTRQVTVGMNTLTIGGIISGSTFGLTKAGSGVLLLNGANTYTGATTISAGTIMCQGAAFSTTPRTWTIASGAVFNLDGTIINANGTTTINGAGTLRKTGGLWENNVGSGYNATISMSAGGMIDIQSGSSIYNGGWLVFTWTANLASLNIDGNLNLADGNDVYGDALTGSGTVSRSAAASSNLRVGGNGGSGVFSGVISNASGTTSLIKTGSGTQTLSGANSYTGATTVSAGTLLVNGSTHASSAVAVNSGGTLGGTGTVNGAITTASGGTMAPGATTGNSIGTLNTAAVTFTGGTYSVDVNGTTPSGDNINSTGTVALGAGVAALTVANATSSTVGKVYTIVSAVTSVTGTFSGKANGATFTQAGRNFLITYTSTAVTLTDVPSLNTKVWNGGGASGSWILASNWLGSVAPVATNDLVFAGSVQTSPTNDFPADTSFGSITFATGASAFTLAAGARITLTGNITNSSSNTQTMNIAMIANVATVTVDGSSNIVVGGIVSETGGARALTKTGTNTLIMSAANSYTGATTISAGTLQIGNAGTTGSLSTTSTITNNATLTFNRTDAIAGGTHFSNTISGTGAVIQNGSGAVTFSGAASYTGMTSINAGTLILSKVTSYASSTTTVNGPGVLELTSTDAVVDNWRLNTILAGAGTINKTGSGWIQTFTNAHTFSGTFNIQVGTFGASYTTSDWTGITADFNISAGALLDARSQAITVGSLNGAGSVGTTYGFFLATVNVGGGNKSGTFSGVINGNNTSGTDNSATPNAFTLNLTKTGSGTQILSGANIYSGATTVSAGTLKLGSSSALPGGALSMSGTSILDLNSFTGNVSDVSSSSGTSNITNNSAGTGTGTLNITNQATTISSLITDGATAKVALRISNNNNFGSFTALNSANTFSGGVTLAHNNVGSGTRLRIISNPTMVGTPGAIVSGPWGTGTITIGESATDKAGILLDTANTFTIMNAITFNTALGTDRVGIRLDTTGHIFSGIITANLAAATFCAGSATAGSASITGQITGPLGLVLNNTAGTPLVTITLNNAGTANDYQGDTNIMDVKGVLVLGAANQIPNGAGKGNVTVTAGALNLGGFSDQINGISGSGTVDGISGTPTLTVGDNNATTTFSGVIKNTAGNLAVTKIGSGTQTLSGANTYTGATTISAGTLQIGNAGTTGSLSASSTITNNATLTFNRTNTVTGGTDFKSGIGGTGAVTQAGSGTLIFTGANTYTGATTVSAGTLLVNGSTHASSAVAVNSGGTLGGTGTVNGAITTAAGGTMAPGATTGNSIGTLNTAGVTFTGGTYSVDVDGTTPSGDNINSTGTVALGAGVAALTVANATSSTVGKVYTIVSAVTSVTGTFSGKADGTTFTQATRTFLIIYTTTSVTLTDVTGQNIKVWNGGGGTNSWIFATNWVGGVAPVASDDLVFAGSVQTSPTNNFAADTSFSSIRFATGASAFTLAAGNRITLTGNITDSSSNNQNIAIAMILNVATSTISTANTLTMSGIISETGGARAITKSGAGTLTLSGTNSYSGATTVSAGTFKAGSTSAFGTNSAVTLANVATAILDITGFSNSIGSLAGGGATGGNVTLGAATLTVGGDGASTSYDGVISGTGALTKSGAGTQTLTRANTYTGTTTINAGTLAIQSTYASASHVIASGAVLELNVFAGTRDYANTTFSGAGTLRKTGVGTAQWTTAAATFSLTSGSLIDIVAGTLEGGSFGNEVWTSNLSDLTVALGATFRGDEANVRVNKINGAGIIKTGYTLAGYVKFTLGIDNGTGGDFSGTIIDDQAAGNIEKVGTGTQILSGANTYTGTTTSSAGTLQIGNGGTTGSLSTSSAITNNATLTFNRTNTVTGGVDFQSGIGGTGAVTQAGSGTLIFTGANTYTGTTTISAGTLQIGNGGTTGSLSTSSTITNNATLTFNRTNTVTGGTDFKSGIGGTGAVTQAGSGTLIFTGANTYTGATTVSAGTFQIGNGSTTGSLSTTSTITNNATLTFNRTNTMTQGTDFKNVISGSGAIIQMGAGGTLVLNGSNTYTGTTSVQNGTLSINTILDVSGGASAVGAPTSAANGTIALGSTTTTGTLVYTGTAQNTNRVIDLAGTTGGGIIDQSGTGLLKFTSAFTATGVGAKTLTVQGSTAGTGEISAAMVNGSGTTALTKTGTGVWTLSGTNTYTGATTVSAGTLLVNGSTHASSAVAVNGTGTLGGTGTVNGTMTMAAGGTIAPGLSGVSIGTLLVKTTTMHASSIYSVDLSGASAADLLSAAGQTVTCAGTLTVANNAGAALGNAYTIINAGVVSGTFSGLANTAVFAQGGRLYRITYSSTTVTLTDVAPVVSSRGTMDANGNGKLDRIRLTFDQNLNDNVSGLTVTVAGYTVTGFSTGTANDAVLDVLITELGSTDTGAIPLVRITANTSLKDAAATTLVQVEGAGTAPTDTAKPVLMSALYSDGGTNGVSGGNGDTVVLTFSENVTSASMVVADLTLPVSGDTLSTSTIANKSTATPTITVTLVGTPLLSPGNTYASGTLGAGKPSGIYLSTAANLRDQATVPNTGLIGTVAADAVDIGASPSSSISIEWNDTNDTVDKTWTLGTAALSTSYVSSMYTVHNIGYSTVALATTSSNSTSATTTWTVQTAVGANQFTMKADASTPLDAVYELTLSTSAITLAPFVRSGTTQDFKLQLSTPTTSATAATQAITVTITASQY